MNHNKIIILSFSLLFSNYIDAMAPKTCLQKSYRELKKIVFYTTIGTYIHQNVMTQQDITKLPNLTADEIVEYKNKLKTTIHNGCASLDNTYLEFKKFISDIKSQPNNSCTNNSDLKVDLTIENHSLEQNQDSNIPVLDTLNKPISYNKDTPIL